MPDLTAAGSNLQWYNNNSLDTLVASGSPFATGDTVVGAHEYFVTQTVAGCEGPADSAILTINPIPAPPIASDTAVCVGDSVPSLIAIGTLIKWYDDPGPLNLLSSNDSFATGETAPGVYDYYVTQELLGCASLEDTVLLTINSTVPPTTTDTGICVGGSAAPLVAVGNDINWYSDSALTLFEVNNDSLFPSDVLAGVYSYWVARVLAIQQPI